MLIKRRRGWEISERLATPESVFLNRRQILAASGFVLAGGLPFAAEAATAPEVDPTQDLYPAPRNETYKVERAITAEKVNIRYNNFYEYGTDKDIYDNAQKLKLRPWQVRFDGMVEKEFTVGVDDLIRKMKLEERVYRHRCVERWSMVVPWTGFPMVDLIAFAKPKFGAKYVRMETFKDPKMAPDQGVPIYPWPYVEGLTMAEATNELTFMVTGAYGKPGMKSMGAPLRIHLPWKYGFKSIKSIVRFTFTDQKPVNWWQTLQAREYGFWANVNPDVPHPRWSQAKEQIIGTNDVVPTTIYNGYGPYVADIYKDMKGEKLFM